MTVDERPAAVSAAQATFVSGPIYTSTKSKVRQMGGPCRVP